MSFSKGTRVCPGLEIAWVEMRLLLAHIFLKFDMNIDEKTEATDDDILTYRDGFTSIPKNWCQRLSSAPKLAALNRSNEWTDDKQYSIRVLAWF